MEFSLFSGPCQRKKKPNYSNYLELIKLIKEAHNLKPKPALIKWEYPENEKLLKDIWTE